MASATRSNSPQEYASFVKLLKLKITLTKEREKLILLKEKLEIYYNDKRKALRHKERLDIRNNFIKINKMTPEYATDIVEENLPKVEAMLDNVTQLLKKSQKELAINPLSYHHHYQKHRSQ